MKKLLTSALLIFSVMTRTYAQDVIAVQHNGTSRFYYGTQPYDQTWLQRVFNQTVTGDTVYLPGKIFNLTGDITLNQGIVLIGTGIHPDSASVFGANNTVFNGYHFIISSGADNAQFHGITFNQDIFLGNSTTNQNLHNLKFYRCEFMYGLYLAWTTGNTSSNMLFESCHLQSGIDIKGVQTVKISGCVIGPVATISEGNQSTTVSNCLIINSGMAYSANAYYIDNIFTYPYSSPISITEPNRMYNNLFVLLPGGSLLWGSGVVHNSTDTFTTILSDVFVAPPATNALNSFDYHANYHLVTGTTISNFYNVMSSTHGQVGLYGGNPNTYWKEGTLPFNPHWRELTVAPNSVNGYLNVGLKAAGQVY